jgi:KDO2-lipid IV(A) lauroyltransferase
MREQTAPPIIGLFRDKASRQAAVRYWLHDTALGLLNFAIHNALRLLPTAWCSGFGAANAIFCPRRFPDSDARARNLMLKVRPDEASTPADPEAAMRRLWRCAARTMAEYSVIHRLWSEGRIAVDGLEHLEATRAAGRPVILAGVHLGNWETIGAAVNAAGYSIAATYEPPENRFEHRIANRVRSRYGMRMVYPDHQGGRAAYRCLVKEEQIFLFYVDELFRGKVSAPSFGRAPKTEGNIANVSRLARLTNAEIIVVYSVRLGDEPRFKVTFLPPIQQTRTADSRADLVANVAAIDRVIAPIIKDHLDQWFYALDFDFEPHPV